MNEIAIIKELSRALIGLIRLGCATRVTYCAVCAISNTEDAGMYKKRAMTTVGFYILAESINAVKTLLTHYYGTPF
jgi:hypothetical protein